MKRCVPLGSTEERITTSKISEIGDTRIRPRRRIHQKRGTICCKIITVFDALQAYCFGINLKL